MKLKLPITRFFSAMLISFFLFSFAFEADAQLRVVNNTACDIFIWYSQVDSNLGGCNLCNTSTAFTLVAGGGGIVIIPADPFCGVETWYGVRWITTLSTAATAFGYTRNPFLGGACGPEIPADDCGGVGTTSANWLMGGLTGPATVVIN
ncbi:MAG: hypothetical protein GYB31_03990 [Bacteroidetes bacterium]|nr:hypothetical protein [Bacteroidota bacterium]